MKKLAVYLFFLFLVFSFLSFNGSGFNKRIALFYIPQRVTAFSYLFSHFLHYHREPPADRIIAAKSKKYNIPVSLIYSLIDTESSFRQYAISPTGAMGYMQLMPQTIKYLKIKDPFSREENIEGGVRYFSLLFEKYDSLELALAAYNSGPGNVDAYAKIPPFKETQHYIRKIKKKYNKFEKNEK